MSKTQRHQQEALWEFLNTELNFINKLTIVKEVCHNITVIRFIVNLFDQI